MKFFDFKKVFLSLLFCFSIAILFAQELPKKTLPEKYLEKIKAEGYELVDQGSFNQGELPKTIYLDLNDYYKYKVCAIPSGKLKAIAVSMGYQTMTSTKANPVFYWTHVPTKSGKTRFKFMNTKKRGKFKLSPENSVYYIIAKKPI
jgi:hypothetical protein